MTDHCTTDFCIWRTICLVPVRCISSIRHMYTTDFAYDGPIFLVPFSPSYPSSPVFFQTILISDELHLTHLPREWMHNLAHMEPSWYWEALYFNPLILRAAKTGLMFWEIFYLLKHFLENIWRRNVDQNPNSNSLSNILGTFTLCPSYIQKYESSRRYFVK